MLKGELSYRFMYHKMASTSLGKDGLTKLNIATVPDMFLSIVFTFKSSLPVPLQDLLNVYSDVKSH